uniref:Major facilitator superfamily associated domain-containing protein n=1 Tax=Ascaris lumbricoides TaxID=6252 RepID=A0A0M3HKY4_ASCLU
MLSIRVVLSFLLLFFAVEYFSRSLILMMFASENERHVGFI